MGTARGAVCPAPAQARSSLAAVQPRDRDRQSDEHDPGRGDQRAGEVARTSTLVRDVLDVHQTVDGGERPEEERDRRAQRGPQRGEDVDRPGPEHERERGGERVLIDAHPRLAVKERVVERV
jgi:hypothetical protein